MAFEKEDGQTNASGNILGVLLVKSLTSRKFLLTVFGAATVSLASFGVIDVNDERLWQLVTLILGYLGVQGAADVVRTWRESASQEDRRE